MKWVLILESDSKFFEELQSSCSEIDSDIHCAQFISVHSLLQWFKAIHRKDLKNNISYPAEGDSVELAIFSAEQLGDRRVQLVKKMSDYLKEKGLLAEARETLPVILTSFEQDEGFSFKKFQSVYIENVLFKPFDRLIVPPKIKFALNGTKALSDIELYKEVPYGTIEMRKDLQILRVSELGFTSLSQREIKLGEIAIYDHLMGENFDLPPVFGICTLSRPSQHLKSMYLCHIEYLAPTLEFSNKLRDYLFASGEKETLREVNSQQKVFEVAVIHPSEKLAQTYQSYASENFKNLEIVAFKGIDDFVASYDAELEQQAKYQKIKQFISQTYSFDLDPSTHKVVSVFPELQGNFLHFDRDRFAQVISEITQKLSLDEQKILLDLLSGINTQSVVLSVFNNSQMFPLRFTRTDSHNSKVTKISMELVSEAEYQNISGVKNRQLPLAIFLSEDLEGSFLKIYPQASRPYQYKGVPLYLVTKGSQVDHGKQQDDVTGYRGALAETSQGRFACLYLSHHLPVLKLTDKERVVAYISSQMYGAVGVHVKAKAFSEVHIELEYRREIKVGKFRHFKLHELKSNETHLVLGRCLGGESTSDPKIFKNVFALYSTSNRDLVFIRKWLHEQYRLAKQNEAA